MPIRVYTGNPRNGKTALMVEELIAIAKQADRPIFESGIDGLKPGYATNIPDPRRWNDVVLDPQGKCACGAVDAAHTHVLPTGSILFVDEAWKWFGHLHGATNQPTPPHVLAMAEHGHRSLDFVFTTQLPNQLYPFMRGLIADHSHVVRRFWTRWIDVYKWAELNDDVKSQGKRDAAIRDSRTLPQKTFGEYKSAEDHNNIKAKIPWKVWLLPVCLVVGAALCWYAYLSLRPSAINESMTGKGRDAAQAAAALQPGDRPANGKDAPLYASPAQYVAVHMPRLAALPWSAPVFDKRGVTADPELFCMSSGEGYDANGEWKDASCSCKTEQSTEYDLPNAQCVHIAQHGGHYNPYKQRDKEPPSQRASDQRASMAQSAAPLPTQGSEIPAPASLASGYGAIAPSSSAN